VPKPCPKCGTAYLLVRERKAGAFYVCDAEGCGFDEPAGDVDRYPVTREVTEEARQAALAAAAAPQPKKRAPRKKADAPTAEVPAGRAPAPRGRAAGGRAAAGTATPKAPKVAASARPKRTPKKK
jgi:hypothetical protein